eukprot:TRINITY_DN12116_c0_g2_i1.p1 TRINITY_DN12116_c0_g2~~TRINITY_DN12116_c0_g2_i1.p1  ORF type:complete len:358 (+),score=33.06 TRINITY_DN12116_c0_g2_i1:108-1076(+)
MAVAMFPLHSIAACLAMSFCILAFGGRYARTAFCGYLLWLLLDRSPSTGGYKWAWRLGITHWLRNSWVWRCSLRDSVGIHLIPTVKLKPDDGPYIFVCHPHGIIGVAPMSHFGTNVTNFEETFPGVPVHLLGHNAIFRIPFFREWCLLHGHATVEKQCCLKLLRDGHSIAIAPGGAKESLECLPGTMRLLLRTRKGFCRLAMDTGASILPVLSFGENELYSTVQFQKGSRARRIQEALQRRLGFALPVFCGRPWLPLMPQRKPIVTFVGAPVRAQPLPDYATPADKEKAVEALHWQYCEALRALFEAHKAKYGLAEADLELV